MADPSLQLRLLAGKKGKRRSKTCRILKLTSRPNERTCVSAARTLPMIRLPICRNDFRFANCVLKVAEPFDQVGDTPPSGHVTHTNRIVEPRMESDFHLAKLKLALLRATPPKGRSLSRRPRRNLQHPLNRQSRA